MSSSTNSEPTNGAIATHDYLGKQLILFSWLQHRKVALDIADFNLTVPQFFTLDILMELGGEASVGKLARTTNQVPATMSGISDRLVRDGLVVRRPSRRDRRSNLLVITPKGENVVRLAQQRTIDEVESSLQGINEQERVVVGEFLHNLLDSLAN